MPSEKTGVIHMTFRKPINVLSVALVIALASTAFAQSTDTDQDVQTGTPIADAISAIESGTPGDVVATSAPDAVEMADKLLEKAATACVKAQKNLAEDKTREDIPACVVHDTMVSAFWASAANQHGMWLEVAENDIQTDVAISEKTRDDARVTTAKVSNKLASTEAAGELATVTAANTLAAAKAAGELASAEATLVLEAVGAETEAPTADKDAKYIERFDTLDETIATMAADVADSIWIQRNICSSNPGVSWCP